MGGGQKHQKQVFCSRIHGFLPQNPNDLWRSKIRKKFFLVEKSQFISEANFSGFCLKFINFRQKSPLISAMTKKIVRIDRFLAKIPNDLWEGKNTKKKFFAQEFMDFFLKPPMIYGGRKLKKKLFLEEIPMYFRSKFL